ncbi:adipocyte enhancer-binding protein 1-like [Patiria miniata]|uniref:F5/8 type C domain-containing protein n=1 Tax=Patiria miniata TaxID=46514 RepID=A0A914A9H0_PATMI|nr:adipocyte enhancer-binding protein 1-like [Patiria miniata]
MIVDEPTPNNNHCYGYRGNYVTTASDIPNIRLIVPGSGALPVLIADIKVKTCWLVMKNPRKMWVFSWTLWLFSSFFILPVRGNTCSAMVQAAPGDDLTALRNKAFASFRAQCRGKRDDVSCSVEGPLGMEDGRIRDERITASSFWRNLASHAPSRARLNTQGYAAAWCNDETTDDISPWIQVHFDGTVTITGLITQGRGDSPCDQWVTEYQVTYSEDGQSWNNVTDADGTPIKFPGNKDKNTPVTTHLPFALRTRILRIHPTAWNHHCSMRFEVIGCY